MARSVRRRICLRGRARKASAEIEGVAGGGARASVVEDAPRLRRVGLHGGGEPVEIRCRVRREIRARRSVPAVIRYAPEPAWRVEPGRSRRVGGNPRYTVRLQQFLCSRSGPARMAWLAHDEAGVARAENVEKASDAPRFKCERRRQLNEDWAKGRAEALNVREEPFEQRPNAEQRPIVGYRLRQLHGESEVGRHGGRPARVRFCSVRTVERRINFRRIQARRVPLEL